MLRFSCYCCLKLIWKFSLYLYWEIGKNNFFLIWIRITLKLLSLRLIKRLISYSFSFWWAALILFFVCLNSRRICLSSTSKSLSCLHINVLLALTTLIFFGYCQINYLFFVWRFNVLNWGRRLFAADVFHLFI